MEAAAVYVQSQLREVGVRMELTLLESGLNRRLREGAYEAGFGRFEPFPPVDIQWLNGKISIGYSNPHVTAVVDSARGTMVPDETDRLYAGMMPILRSEQPITILFPEATTFVARRRIRGLSTPYWADPVWHMEELMIEEQHETESRDGVAGTGFPE